ncbi:MAG: PilZ domain-containing protein [Desulfocapsa sp.]|nr:PilZ domain-containing protein [Desulfocapsa sp.]
MFEERRAYKRIPMKDVTFTCHVLAGDYLCKVVCLSLSGTYLECPAKLTVGELCEVIITSNGPIFDEPLSLSAKVVRVDEEGTAMEFCNTVDKDYTTLQTILLYHSAEPHIIAAEFPTTPHL